MRPAAICAAALAAVAAGCGGDYEEEALVRDYCDYGSVSDAQLDHCREQVSADEVRSRNTPTARWAKDGGECGLDAGPFCFRREHGELDEFCKGQQDVDAPRLSPAECRRRHAEIDARRRAAGVGDR